MNNKYINNKMKRIKQNLIVYNIVALFLLFIYSGKNILTFIISILIIDAIYLTILFFIEKKMKNEKSN